MFYVELHDDDDDNADFPNTLHAVESRTRANGNVVMARQSSLWRLQSTLTFFLRRKHIIRSSPMRL